MAMLLQNNIAVWVLIALAVTGLGWWYWQEKNAVTIAIPNSQGLQTYTNAKYGFSFKYSVDMPRLIEYPEGNTNCEKKDGFAGKDLNTVVVAESNDYQFYVTVTCQPLTDDKTVYPEEGAEPDRQIVDGKTIYEHTFTSALNYRWSVLQFALDAEHYAEIAYTVKSLPEPSPGYVELSGSDWGDIIASIVRSGNGLQQ